MKLAKISLPIPRTGTSVLLSCPSLILGMSIFLFLSIIGKPSQLQLNSQVTSVGASPVCLSCTDPSFSMLRIVCKHMDSSCELLFPDIPVSMHSTATWCLFLPTLVGHTVFRWWGCYSCSHSVPGVDPEQKCFTLTSTVEPTLRDIILLKHLKDPVVKCHQLCGSGLKVQRLSWNHYS